MKRTTAALGLATVAMWSAGVFAQGRNFAGSWTIDAEKTAAARAAAPAGAMMGGGGGGRGGGGVARSGGDPTVAQRVAGDAGAAGAVMAAGGGGGGRGGGGARGGGEVAAGGVAPSAPRPTTIALDANSFTVGNGTNNTVYKLDGTPTVTENPMGTTTAKAAWKGDKLVIERTTGTSSSTESWYVEGDSLIRETTRTLPDGTQSAPSKTYYKRS